MKKIGLDLGTKTLVAAFRDENDKIVFKQEINGFFKLNQSDNFTKNMLISQKVPYIEIDNQFIALGGKAEKLAYAVNKTLLRPMAEGTVSKEQEAIKIMATIVQALIGKLDEDAILYYSIPSDALNKKTNVGYHDKIAKMIFDNYKKSDAKIKSYPINEARALAICSQEQMVIAISWGAGMVNACYTMFGIPLFEFSLVGSGDWIDTEAAKQFGYDPDNPRGRSEYTPTSIAQAKHKIDLNTPIDEMNRVDQAIALHYQLLIEKVVQGIIDGFNDNSDKVNVEGAVPIVMSGGTSSPEGFTEYFSSIISKCELPFEISEIKRMDKPLYSVAEGCLLAAEAHDME